MKKLATFITMLAVLLFSTIIKASAETPNYSKDITENTSIADDFKSLNIDLNKYTCYTPENYFDYLSEKNKITLIDFTTIKISEEQAQIYLYVYCPLKYNRSENDYIDSFFVTFDIENYVFENSLDYTNFYSKEVAYDDVHGIYKLRCQKFNFDVSNKITITSIISVMAIVEYRTTCFPNLTKEFIFENALIPPLPSLPATEISNSSSIADDFNIMGMSIEDYYISKNFDFSKWFVVAMGFNVKENNKIQTYLYVYNPTQSSAGAFVITYKLNNQTITDYFSLLKIDAAHGLYKIEGFEMDYKSNYDISVLKIEGGSTSSSSEFELEVSFDASSEQEVTIKPKFDTTIIIDECTVIEVEVHQDDNFINGWNSFWGNYEPTFLVFFYNFNFPDHIEYDSVEYAKFQYDYLTYHEEIRYFEPNKSFKELKSREKVISEYHPGSNTIRVNKHSQELNFPTFYLGDRYKDKQFGDWKLPENIKKSFASYDCSVLLDSTYKNTKYLAGQVLGVTGKIGEALDYTTLDKVELIELHYENDGALYKCQVISRPIRDKEFEKGETIKPKSWWDLILEWLVKIFDFIFYDMFHFKFWVPKTAKQIITGVILFVTVFWVLPKIIKWIKKLLKALFGR